MRFNRRIFMSTGALAAAGATLPVSNSDALAVEPLTEKDDMCSVLDCLEEQIGKLRARITEIGSEPCKAALDVRRDAIVLHRRAQRIADQADTLRKLAYNESLAEQQAKYEQRSREQFAVWETTQQRIWKIMRLGRIAQRGGKRSSLQKRCLAILDKECAALSDDYVTLFHAVLRTPQKPS